MKKLLDIGCGPGTISNIGIYSSLKKKFDIWGIDPLKNNIDLIKLRYPKGKFRTGKGEKLPYQNKYFDAILARHVLEHVNDPDLTLEQMRRVSKTGATLIMAVPHPLFEKITAKITPHYIEKGHHHQRVFNKKTVSALLNKHGYKITSIKNDKWPFFVINMLLANLARFNRDLKMQEQTGIFLISKKNYIKNKNLYRQYLYTYKFLSLLNSSLFFLNFFIPFELLITARKLR